MNTLDYLFGPNAGAFWPSVVTAVLVAALGALLSPMVVLKRMAFIGQGVSHAAFGGVGVALVLGLGGGTALGQAGFAGVVLAFSIGAALGIAWLADRPETKPDTAIGIVLAASMALGFVLYRIAARRSAGDPDFRVPDLHAVLFGDVLAVGWADAGAALVVLGLVLLAGWWKRRELVFWGFDESACAAFGVSVRLTRAALLVLLAFAVVVAVKLAGIVLATALFVIPGATALTLSRGLGSVWAWSLVSAVTGSIGGLVLSFETDWPAGPGVVLVLIAGYAIARLATARR